MIPFATGERAVEVIHQVRLRFEEPMGLLGKIIGARAALFGVE